MSKRIAALMVITMLLLSVTGCASSYGEASKTENTTEVQSSSAETTAQVTTAAQTTTAEPPTEKPTEPPTEPPTDPPTEPPTEIETEPPATTVSDGDTIELTGTVTVEKDNTSPNFTTYHAILNLDDPFRCYIVGLSYDGTKLYYIDSVQIPAEYRDRVGEHVTVYGKVKTAHTGHHLRDIVLT